MGMMVEGVWHAEAPLAAIENGRFERPESGFRNWVTADGSPGPTGRGGFKAEAGRYHLYVCHACPWAHRTMIFRALKGLEDAITVSVVHWYMGEQGWSFDEGEGVVPDPIFDAAYLHQIYRAANPVYTGKVTVPVLWDKHTDTIVNNESAEIIRMLNGAFDAIAGHPERDYYPRDLRTGIDEVNERVYRTVNNGVYRAGFAQTQEAYEEAVVALFETLDWLEKRLAAHRYLMGERQTEADWRLFTTLLRFDPVYHGHFKCNIRRLADYPSLWNYLRDLYQEPGVAATVHLDHIKRHYYGSHISINPTGIVPVGPEIDYTAPHDRDGLKRAA